MSDHDSDYDSQGNYLKDIAVSKSSYQSIKTPERSDWICYLVGNPGDSWTFQLCPVKGVEPNWFHRKMQEFCFGFKWRKK